MCAIIASINVSLVPSRIAKSCASRIIATLREALDAWLLRLMGYDRGGYALGYGGDGGSTCPDPKRGPERFCSSSREPRICCCRSSAAPSRMGCA